MAVGAEYLTLRNLLLDGVQRVGLSRQERDRRRLCGRVDVVEVQAFRP